MIDNFPIIKQKFMRGDIVQIADELPRSMQHFRKGCKAIIMGSYSELCNERPREDGCMYSDKYKLFFPDTNVSSAWYIEDQLLHVGYLPRHRVYVRANYVAPAENKLSPEQQALKDFYKNHVDEISIHKSNMDAEPRGFLKANWFQRRRIRKMQGTK